MIDVILGLPHLGRGALLERAESLQTTILVSANALSRWSDRRGWREWAGWKFNQLHNATDLAALCLDSAGYTAMAAYGGFPWTVDDYLALAAAHPFKWWASMDYCVEEGVARDREEVLDRISRTIHANRDCRMRAADEGLLRTFMPVIQGRTPEDYERCVDGLALSIETAPVVGIGSMCRRPIHGKEGLVAVLEHLDRLLPKTCRLHAFGVKGSAIPYLKAFAHRVSSLDSQAYGVQARCAARRRGIAKTDRFVADQMEQWLRTQQARLVEPVRRLPLGAPTDPDQIPNDPWEAAIAQARHEIRELIETGDLDHDELTTPWIEQWAADIYRGDDFTND